MMQSSSSRNPNTPIILGIIVAIIIVILIILFMVIMPMNADKEAEKISGNVDSAVSLEEKQAMNNVNATGNIYSKEPSIKMDPDIQALEKPFDAEEQQEEQ